MSGPQRRRFIFPGGGLGAQFRVPVSPAGEVLSPTPEIFLPTDVGEDNKKISGIFPGEVIMVDNGKLYVINTVFSIDCSYLGTTFLSHHFLTVKRFLT